MAYKSAAYRRATGKRRTYKRKSAKRRGKRPALKKMIRREIARNVENKAMQMYNYNAPLITIATANPENFNMFPMGPYPASSFTIPQGVGQGQRVGNRIRTKKLVVRGTIVPLPYDVTLNPSAQPVVGKIWFMYNKQEPCNIPYPQTNQNMFQLGGTQKGFQGDLTDNLSPVNTDQYRILAVRSFKIGFASYTGTGSSATVGTPAAQFWANNDFKTEYTFKVNLTKMYPKQVRFNDGTTLPTSRALFMFITYAPLSGGTFLPNQSVLGLQYIQDFTYEDA